MPPKVKPTTSVKAKRGRPLSTDNVGLQVAKRRANNRLAAQNYRARKKQTPLQQAHSTAVAETVFSLADNEDVPTPPQLGLRVGDTLALPQDPAQTLTPIRPRSPLTLPPDPVQNLIPSPARSPLPIEAIFTPSPARSPLPRKSTFILPFHPSRPDIQGPALPLTDDVHEPLPPIDPSPTGFIAGDAPDDVFDGDWNYGFEEDDLEHLFAPIQTITADHGAIGLIEYTDPDHTVKARVLPAVDTLPHPSIEIPSIEVAVEDIDDDIIEVTPRVRRTRSP